MLLLRLDRAMEERGTGFRRMRSQVLRQQRAHHHFGEQWIEARLRVGWLSQRPGTSLNATLHPPITCSKTSPTGAKRRVQTPVNTGTRCERGCRSGR